MAVFTQRHAALEKHFWTFNEVMKLEKVGEHANSNLVLFYFVLLFFVLSEMCKV